MHKPGITWEHISYFAGSMTSCVVGVAAAAGCGHATSSSIEGCDAWCVQLPQAHIVTPAAWRAPMQGVCSCRRHTESHQQVFFLHESTVGLCDQLDHIANITVVLGIIATISATY